MKAATIATIAPIAGAVLILTFFAGQVYEAGSVRRDATVPTCADAVSKTAAIARHVVVMTDTGGYTAKLDVDYPYGSAQVAAHGRTPQEAAQRALDMVKR